MRQVSVNFNRRLNMISRTICRIALLMLITAPLFINAQPRDWKESTANDGKIKVKYIVEKVEDKAGDNLVIAEYIVKTTANIKLNKAEKLLRNANKYKEFLDNTEVSKNVGTTTKSDWLLYLLIDAPWPMPDADCVQRVTVNRTEKELTVNCVAAPDAYPLQGEKRMIISDTKFYFIEKSPGVVDVTVTTRFSPMGPITKFMLETWFPKGPVKLMERLLEQIKAD